MKSAERTMRQARIALVDATVIVAEIDAAVKAIEQSEGGYPASVIGASAPSASGLVTCTERTCERVRPCPDHDVGLTSTERQATTHDPAQHDGEKLTEHIKQAAHHARAAAAIVHRWAHVGIDVTSVRNRLAAIDEGIWCKNCIRFGEHNPREPERTECHFCRSFRIEYKRPASQAIWHARNARGGRIDVGTIDRILKSTAKA